MKNQKFYTVLKAALLVLGLASLLPMFVSDINNVDLMLYCAYAFIGLALVIMVVLTVANMGKNPGGSKIGTWVAVATAVAAVIVHFTVSAADPVALADGSIVDDKMTLTLTDTMLYTAYATFAGVVVAMVYGVIRNAFK
ncbi:MAG: hypothetical protein J6R31_05215 [Rikenellaceae bacterium]|nr:hypothetical protein [Rikenellaceae bacterium]MBO5759421.1 hypothetical protein [Rikenellaceae bacterium]MBO7168715.1 hypothetical protein [Rikenellaceae bacterium]